MTDFAIARAFLLAEIEALAPFEFVAALPAGSPLHGVEVTRLENGTLEVRVPGRPEVLPSLPVPVRSALLERGFTNEDPADSSEPWCRGAPDAAAAVDLLEQLLFAVFEQKRDLALDVKHGTHRAEHEARRKLAAVRERLERVLTEMNGRAPERDDDGDYVLSIGDVQVEVAPRASVTGPVVVRIFAVTNVGVNVTPDLGLFLARMNFGLMFGRFSLDAEHAAIWFDETLLGEEFTDEALRFTIGIVASTADEWDDRLKQMFGGAKHREVASSGGAAGKPTIKPGGGGYL
jgi:hypothetical protein